MMDLNRLSRPDRLTFLLRDYLNKKELSQYSDESYKAYTASGEMLRAEMQIENTVVFYLANSNFSEIKRIVFPTNGMSITDNGFLRSPHILNDWNGNPQYFNCGCILRFTVN